MASNTIAARPAGTRVERYRQAERALWAHYGLNPAERWVELKQPPARLRLLEAGSGAPVLFVHGTAGPGSWPALVRELRGFRCLVLDRPGWGLSSAVGFAGHEYQALVADMLRGVLDGLGLDRAHVVGGSIGDVWALRLAARHPARVNRVVLLGGGPVVPQVRVPPVIRLIASPAGALMVRMPANPQRVRSILRNSGHGASLDAGRFPEPFIDWRVALERDTHSMRNEREMGPRRRAREQLAARAHLRRRRTRRDRAADDVRVRHRRPSGYRRSLAARHRAGAPRKARRAQRAWPPSLAR